MVTAWEPNPAPTNYQEPQKINVPMAPGEPDAYASAALQANTGLIASTRRLVVGISGINTNGSKRYIMAFDVNVVPAAGSIPRLVQHVAANEAFDFSGQLGLRGVEFHNGIYLANSTDPDKLTAGSADTLFHATYAKIN